MKKPKLRLDKAAIQEFFIQNAEKIVFGLLALVFVFFVYSAIRITGNRYDKTPEQLNAVVAKGKTEIRGHEPKTDKQVQDYDLQAKQNRTPIDEKPYGRLARIDPAVFSTRESRGEPALFAVEGLRGTAGFGAMPIVAEQPAAGDERPGIVAQGAVEIRGQRWIVLTGLVSYDKELRAFDDALRNAGPTGCYDPQRDTPYYIACDVQRAEVVSPADGAKPNWDNVPVILSNKALSDALKRWGQPPMADMVAPEHLFQPRPTSLTFPLPPVTGSPWTESVAHPPEIPLLDLGQANPAGMGGGFGGRGIGPTAPPAGSPPTIPGPKPPDGAGGHEDPYGDNPTEPVAPAGGGPSEGPAAPGAAVSTALLFRFFDFDVQPGKQYVYRVRLVLRNPNYKLKATSLKDAKLAAAQYLKTKWSDESDPPLLVSVPDDTRILAVSVTSKAHDPVGRILVNKWSKKHGCETHDEFDVVRGQVADFLDRVAKPENQSGGAGAAPRGPGGGGMLPIGGGGGGMMPMPGGVGGGGRGGMPLMPGGVGGGGRGGMPLMPGGVGGGGVGGGGRGGMPLMPGGVGGYGGGGRGGMPPGMFPVAGGGSFKVNYITRATVVDFRGGEPLRGRKANSLHLSAPGAILLQDRDGNLVVRDELDDLAAYKQIVPSETPVPQPIQPKKPPRERPAPKGGPHDKQPPGGHRRPGGNGNKPKP
jgi:hypothetical protein